LCAVKAEYAASLSDPRLLPFIQLPIVVLPRSRIGTVVVPLALLPGAIGNPAYDFLA
jgi:hypothetical protein